MPFRLPPVLSVAELPLAELYAARLDGELVALDDRFSPIDQPDDIRHRAGLLAAMIPARLIAEQHTAAWVMGVRSRPPLQHQFCAATGARVCLSPSSPYQLREVVIDETETFTLGELRLTTPLRTAVDIARTSPTFDAADRDVVAALMRLWGFGAEDCLLAMNKRRNLPQKRAALARIRAAEQLAA
jgi:hypothetical protein